MVAAVTDWVPVSETGFPSIHAEHAAPGPNLDSEDEQMAALSCSAPIFVGDLPVGQPFAAFLLRCQRLCDALTCALAKCYLTNVLVCQIKLARHGGDSAPHGVVLQEAISQWGRIHGGSQLSENGYYAEPRMQSTQKTRLRVSADLRPQIAEALRAARRSLGFTQVQLAELLGSSQGAITRWERALDSPPISAISVLAQIVPEEQKGFWLSAGAITDGSLKEQPSSRYIPVLRDPAAAGTPREVNEAEVDFHLTLPTNMLPRTGRLVGLKVEGDSMSPILETGYIALVDVAQRKASSMVNRMVAARDRDGVTIKWLRKQSEEMYLLVPQKTSQRHQIQIMRPEGEWSIVGEVVMWIGQPPPPKRK